MYKDMQEILAAVARGDLSPDEAEFEMATLDNAQEAAKADETQAEAEWIEAPDAGTQPEKAAEPAAAAAKEPVVKAPARSSESELDIMVED